MKEFSAEWFDASSAAWMKNKKRIGQMYVYICEYPSCSRKVKSTLYCSKHDHMNKIETIDITSDGCKTSLTANSPTQRRSPRLLEKCQK